MFSLKRTSREGSSPGRAERSYSFNHIFPSNGSVLGTEGLC